MISNPNGPRNGKEDDDRQQRDRPETPPRAPESSKNEQPASVAELEAQVAALKERVLRELAEQENIRMRDRREKDEAVKFAAASFARDIVGGLDNLGRAIGSFPADLPADSPLKDVLSGLKATERSFLEAFKKHGIARIDPLGEAFDPDLHDALQLIEDPHQTPGKIIAVLEPGYLYHDRLLRPAKVSVAKGGG